MVGLVGARRGRRPAARSYGADVRADGAEAVRRLVAVRVRLSGQRNTAKRERLVFIDAPGWEPDVRRKTSQVKARKRSRMPAV